MKKRVGFVSNSSSSSFICDVCGNVESGWDMCPSEANMYECQSGHTFCRDEAIEAPLDELKEYAKEKFSCTDEELEDFHCLEDFDELDDWEYYIPACACPICTMTEIPDNLINAYILKTQGLSIDEVKSEIKSKFKDINKLQKFLNNV